MREDIKVNKDTGHGAAASLLLLLLLVLMSVGKPTKMVHSRHLLDRSVERIMFRKLDNNITINSGGGDMKKKTLKKMY